MKGHKKRLTHNFISLSLVQGLSILFPLLTFPFLLRVLGVESFGVFTLIQTFVMYFDMFVSFGFGLTATKYITKNISDTAKTREIISGVYFIKFILFLISLVSFLICLLFIPYLKEHPSIVFISAMYLLGNLLFPDWYFLGIQKMKNITVVAFVSKFLSLVMLVLLVKKSDDIDLAVFSISAGNLIAGLLGFFLLTRSVSLRIKLPEKSFVIGLLKESSYVFTSIILAPLYSSLNLFILQFFTNPLMVGYYAIAEKIFSAVSMLTNIANRTFFPHLTSVYHSSIAAYKRNIKSILRLFLLAFTILAVLQFFTAEYVVKFLSGKESMADIGYAVEILMIMSAGQLFSPYVSFFFQLLIIQGQKREAIANTLAVVLINLVSACLFAYFYSGKGMAINLSMIVFLIGLLNFISFNRKIKSLSLHERAPD